MEIEEQTKRRFLLEAKPDVHLDHFLVLGQGKLESLRPEPALEEGKALEVKLVEVGLYDPTAGVGTVNGTTVSVGNAAPLVGKKVKARIERVFGDEAYASIVSRAAVAERPITAEDEAEKPTRAPRARKAKAEAEAGAEAEIPAAAPAEAETETETAAETAEPPEEVAEDATPAPPKKKTRRGSRGGRGRKKKPAAATAAASDNGAPAEAEAVEPSSDGAGPKIHVPDPDLGREPVEAVAVAASETAGDASNDGEAPKPKKRTRRGSRGGRNRKRKTAAAAPEPSAPAE
jgi:predicted RNA-binding protein with TRAM domain